MFNEHIIEAPTREEALAVAEAFKAKKDPYTQPHIKYYGPTKDGEKYSVTVGWYGLD